MKIQPLYSVLLALALSAPVTGSAIDIDDGADSLYGQLRESNSVVTATFEGIEGDSLKFRSEETIDGVAAGAQFSVALPDGYAEGMALTAGQSYLVFLKVSSRFEKSPAAPVIGPIVPGRPIPGPGPIVPPQHPIISPKTYSLPLSLYSVQPLVKTDLPQYKDAVQFYRANLLNKGALKAGLARFVTNENDYLQYSAVSDLVRHTAFTAQDATELMGKLNASQIKSPRAQSITVRMAGKFKLIGTAAQLENIAIRANTPNSLRVDALNSLEKMGAQDSLRRVLPVVEKLPSSKIKRRVGEITNPRKS